MRIRALLQLFLALALLPGGTARAAAVDHASGARQLYATHCARCHGPTGHGDGPQAAVSHRKPHSFTDCDWMDLMSDATLFLVITEGSPAGGFRSGMPAFGGKLSYDQVVGLIQYVRGFCKRRPTPTPDLGAQASASWNAVSAR